MPVWLVVITWSVYIATISASAIPGHIGEVIIPDSNLPLITTTDISIVKAQQPLLQVKEEEIVMISHASSSSYYEKNSFPLSRRNRESELEKKAWEQHKKFAKKQVRELAEKSKIQTQGSHTARAEAYQIAASKYKLLEESIRAFIQNGLKSDEEKKVRAIWQTAIDADNHAMFMTPR